ncbi:Thoeris anti-defense Tad2 family protein [Amphibacillus jilinensis]|uniref:Thoeris anti-defense Tad2 family protein n=1 Tax=Amphibacillus jilinensis TaxID=1216008 RepID=UPI0003644948|nr:MW1434 family type I TA system toxin [Amphibacillus jilinensis]
MDIQQATTTALEENKFITRSSGPSYFTELKIKPTNSSSGCEVFVKDDKKSSAKCWNPNAEDLMADDWIVVK